MKPRKKPRKPRTVWVMALNGQPMQVRSSKADAEYAIHRMEHDVPGKWTCFQYHAKALSQATGATMNQQNAFARIAELEAKLKIATENCEQAVKERDLLQKEVFDLNDRHDARLAAAEAVCELVDKRLPPSFDPKMDNLIAKWMNLKEYKP